MLQVSQNNMSNEHIEMSTSLLTHNVFMVRNLPRSQANNNHVLVLHEARICTQFPLHRMNVK